MEIAMSRVAHKTNIPLSALSGEIEPEWIAESSPLAPGDHGVMVEELGDEYYILDGFHRVAGYLAHGDDDAQITVIVVDDEGLAAYVSEPGPEQDKAIERINDALA